MIVEVKGELTKVVSSDSCLSKGVQGKLGEVVACWPGIGGTLLVVMIVPLIWSEGKTRQDP